VYTIRWLNSRGENCNLVGRLEDVVEVASLFEKSKRQFKTCTVDGVALSQEDFRCGGYKYWLAPHEYFRYL
jgi:hypothetical protein